MKTRHEKGNRLGTRLSLAEFVRRGYLQEANRRFFHPLGLALTVTRSANGVFRELWVQDLRRDPEGLVFDVLSDLDSKTKARCVSAEWRRKAMMRKLALNYVVQPVGRDAPKDRSLCDRTRKTLEKHTETHLIQGKGINAAENKRRGSGAC